MSDAEQVIDRDGDLGEVLDPYHIPVTTATELDSITNNRQMDDVLEVFETIQPAIHIPDVGFTYGQMDESTIRAVVDAYVGYVKELQTEIVDQDLDIRLLPTNKGWEPDHFEPYRELRDDYDITDYAFYCGQYIGDNAGNALHINRQHVRNFISVVNPEDVMLIGRLSARELAQFAPRVTAAAGLKQWREACETEDGYSRLRYNEWVEKPEKALQSNSHAVQSNLEDY
ncbi:hypothetical protein C483_17348 [Natrialba hulunbeirensis JCM 10989]|uniref:Uncharacterized protein n=1 Tax=Natrialba hulunbeirensis JCM 10989 TaxID=1227493 RepID=L9ZQ51_9EURY|nr:hypothetical protein [Natrialba hulunbeirensis]ELY87687.1 hypothetical protein C483_17348 [Natrialba hulunbeirensis JCM 10989]